MIRCDNVVLTTFTSEEPVVNKSIEWTLEINEEWKMNKRY